MDRRSTPKLIAIKRRYGNNFPQVIIGGCELDIIDYNERVSRAEGHTISIRFPAEFVEWEEGLVSSGLFVQADSLSDE